MNRAKNNLFFLLFLIGFLVQSCTGMKPHDPIHVTGVDVGDPGDKVPVNKLLAMKGRKEIAFTLPLILRLDGSLEKLPLSKTWGLMTVSRLENGKKTLLSDLKLKPTSLHFPLEIDLGLDSSMLDEEGHKVRGRYEIEVFLNSTGKAMAIPGGGYGRLLLEEGMDVSKKTLSLTIEKIK